MQCIRIVSLWKENLEGDAFHWYKVFQFVFLWSVFHLIYFDFYVCTLNLSDFDRELLFFFSYKYDIAPVVCATHLLVFDFLHLLGVSKST